MNKQNKTTGINHKEHKKKRLYARNQNSEAKHWQSTAFFLCDCGAVLEEKYNEVNQDLIIKK